MAQGLMGPAGIGLALGAVSSLVVAFGDDIANWIANTGELEKANKQLRASFIDNLKSSGLYKDVWQAGAILLPIQSVGVMGDERTYEKVVALRAVESTDGMTADWVHLPYDFLMKVSNDIINKVKGVNRVVYDISSKPPATIEWE